MLHHFQKYIGEKGLVSPQSTSLLAVSGGVDSVVMAHLFQKAEYGFGIAHCNFSLRGGESDGDEIFVKKLAEEFSAPFFSKKFDTQNFASQNKMGIQEAARELRYEWLAEVADKNNFAQIATAHHLNDNIETVLFNFAKGTGIRGMRGILSRRENIVRPLLFATKNDLLEYARSEGIEYREDASNLTDKYSRNHIRHHVVPDLERVAPNFLQNAGRSIFHLAEVDELLSFFIEKIRSEVVKKKGELTIIDLKPLLSYPAPKTLLFELVRPFGFNAHQASDMLQSIENQSSKSFYSSTYEAVHFSNLIKIKCRENFRGGKYLLKKENEMTALADGTLRWAILERPPEDLATSSATAFFDLEKIEWPLTLRRWENGDCFHPLGMGGHRKKVQDFFTDRKLSKFEKEAAWILESGGQICWIVGMRMDERFKVSDWTKSCLRVEFSFGPV